MAASGTETWLWMNAETPGPMLRLLKARLVPRLRTLFLSGCCRLVSLPGSGAPLDQLLDAIEAAADRDGGTLPWVPQNSCRVAGLPLSAATWLHMAIDALVLHRYADAQENAARAYRDCHGQSSWQEALWLQTQVLRDLYGNPFLPRVRAAPEWLAWRGGLVVAFARAIHDERRFAEMPVLADALEDAGCQEPALLEHCRSWRLTDRLAHVRGCWVLDTLLGKRRWEAP